MDTVAVWQLVRAFEIAFITLFVGLLVSRIIGKAARRMLAEAELNKLFAAKGARSISDIIGGTIEGLLYLVTVIIVLQQLGLTVVVLHVGIVLLILLVTLILFIVGRELPNVIYGLLMKNNVHSLMNSLVKIGTVEGRLESAGLLGLHVQGKEKFCIPYSFAWNKLKKAQSKRFK